MPKAPGFPGAEQILVEIADSLTRVGSKDRTTSADHLHGLIAELRDVADAVRRERDGAARLLESVAEGVLTVDRHLIIRAVSPRFETRFGIAAREAVGRPCQDVLRGSKCDSDCPLRVSLDKGGLVEDSCEVIRHGNGSAVPVSITATVVRDARGQIGGILAAVRHDPEGESLSAAAATPASPNPAGPAEELRRVLEQHRWNASRTARALGVSRTTLWRRMRRLRLLEPRRR